MTVSQMGRWGGGRLHDESLKGKMMESTDINHTAWRLIGSKKAGKKMVGL